MLPCQSVQVLEACGSSGDQKCLEAGLWGKESVVSSLGAWDPQVGRGKSGGWTCCWTQSCFLLAQAQRLPDASPLLPQEPLEGPSPPGIYGSVGCLIICGGCSSSALLPWEELFRERGRRRERENTQVWGGGPGQKHGLQLWLVFAWMSQLDFPIGLSLLIRLQSEFFGKPGHHLSTTSSAETGKLSLSPSFPPSLSGGLFPF